MVKLIKAEDQDVIDDIVRATNRQSKVEDAQFASTLGFLKKIESYFSARGGEEDNRLYFERRRGQYRNEGVPAIRLFDVKETARCYAATGLKIPEVSSRYPNRLTAELLNEVYNTSVSESDYYASCFALYRLKILIANKRIDTKYSKLRWHILTAAALHSELTKAKKQTSFEKLYDFFVTGDDASVRELAEMIAIAIPDPNLSRDVLKSPPLTREILSNVHAAYG